LSIQEKKFSNLWKFSNHSYLYGSHSFHVLTSAPFLYFPLRFQFPIQKIYFYLNGSSHILIFTLFHLFWYYNSKFLLSRILDIRKTHSSSSLLIIVSILCLHELRNYARVTLYIDFILLNEITNIGMDCWSIKISAVKYNEKSWHCFTCKFFR